MNDTVSSLNNRLNLGYTRWWEQITVLLLIVVELGWLVPWYRTIMQISRVPPISEAALTLGLIMLASYAVAKLGEHFHLLGNLQLTITGLFLVVCLLIAESYMLDQEALRMVAGLVSLNPGAILVFFSVLWTWWRGISLAHDSIRPMVAWHRFEFGILMFIAHILVVSRLGEIGPGLGWFVSFLITGFLAVIFARVSYVGLSKGVIKNPFDRGWFVTTGAVLGSVILAAALISSLLTGQFHLLLEWVAEVIKYLVAAFLFVVSIPGLLFSNVLGPLILWLRQFMKSGSEDQPLLDLESGANQVVQEAQQVQQIPEAIQSLIFWGIIILLLGLFFMRTQRVKNAPNRHKASGPETLLEKGEAKKLLKKVFQEALDELASQLRPVQRQIGSIRIRRIYAELMMLCSELGFPRPASKTPDEFLPEMQEFLSTEKDNLLLLTRAYTRVRYGMYPENRQEVEQYETAWLRIKAEGQRQKRLGWKKLETGDFKDIQRNGV